MQSQLGGKLLIFQNTLPSIGLGRLRLRGEDPRVYGTDKEASLRVPEDPFYKQMAAECTKYQIGINVYAFSDKYTDIASLGRSYSLLYTYLRHCLSPPPALLLECHPTSSFCSLTLATIL